MSDPRPTKRAFRHFTEDADAEIRASAKRWDIPFEFLKTMIAAESAGRWDPDRTFSSLSSGPILTYVGVTKEQILRLGLDWRSVRDSRAAQIDAFAQWLSGIRNKIDIWRGVAAYHYSGAMPYTAGSAMEYADNISAWMDLLENERPSIPNG